MKILCDVIKNMSFEQRIKKAARHMDDALNMRPVRNDLDSIKLL